MFLDMYCSWFFSIFVIDLKVTTENESDIRHF